MDDVLKVQESLRSLGFSDADVTQIIESSKGIRSQGDQSGIRRKEYDLEGAQSRIDELQSSIKELQEQVAVADLAKVAMKAVQEAEVASKPVQEVYTLKDMEEIVAKAVKSAVEPMIDTIRKEGQLYAQLLEKVHRMEEVTKVATKKVTELSGDLPRSLRPHLTNRYEGPTEESLSSGSAIDDILTTKTSDQDPFTWVDEFLATSGQ